VGLVAVDYADRQPEKLLTRIKKSSLKTAAGKNRALLRFKRV